MLAHLPDGHQQRWQGVEVMITGRAREHPTVSRGPVLPFIFLIQIRHNHPPLGTGNVLCVLAVTHVAPSRQGS